MTTEGNDNELRMYPLALNGLDQYFLEGRPLHEVMQSLWNILDTVMTKPLAHLALVFLAIYLFYRGIQKINEKEAQLVEEEQRVRKETIQDLRDELQGTIKRNQSLLDFIPTDVWLNEFQRYLQKLESIEQSYRRYIDSLAENKDGKSAITVKSDLYGIIESLENEIDYPGFELDESDQKKLVPAPLSKPELDLSTEELEKRRSARPPFDASENPEFIGTHRQNLARTKERISQLRSIQKQKRQDMDQKYRQFKAGIGR